MTNTQLKSDISESKDIEDHIDDVYFEHLQKLSIQKFKERNPNDIKEITEFNFLNISNSDSN